jgi:hypothetical protein
MAAAMSSTVRVASFEAGDAEEAPRQSIQTLACNHVMRERRGVAIDMRAHDVGLRDGAI